MTQAHIGQYCAPRHRRGLFRTLLQLRAARRQRLALARMDDSRLCDLGLTRGEAQREAARGFWDAPDNWRL